ncbi:protection of telomeres protein 1 [Fusarium flagelliforme]|uniref:Protection of telomeres protein 1 n=1 Tax=Fusarium flagelliforme TaxID=2675880 RepID=A0A395MDK2_9HYPO|nr:protection of telomeres protein 1 [Fusarium flagelliforme]
MQPALLPNYTPCRDILEGKTRRKTTVNVAGIVVDCRAPMPTQGSDWKCQIRFYDSSIEDGDSISINIFRPKDEFPKVGCGDVILVRSARVQEYGSEMSLITHWSTKISVYEASKIPKPPGNASAALYPRNSSKDTPPDSKENDFVSRMYHTIDRGRIPIQEDFEAMVMTSANVKDKFRLLKDVQDGQFCDIVAQIVRPPFDAADKITLWVSDYTENAAFYNFSIGADAASLGRDGDPWGYLDKFTTAANTTDWPGPFGKRSMQITCWEPYATVIREENMRLLTWIDARNIQIKMSRNGANLEGYLREDRGALGTKFGIHEVDLTVDPENINHHAKAALQRKREYERLRKEQLKDIKEASKAGEKRKKGVETNGKSKKDNARSRRDAKRKKGANRQGQGDEQAEDDTTLVADLNTRVKCENEDKAVSRLAEITSIVQHETTIEGESVKLPLPFVNLNYRANVRIVDFSPPNLADFAHPKKESEYDILSDDGEESVSNSGSDIEDEQPSQTAMGAFTQVRNWEWRFFLELEDAVDSGQQKKQRLWVLVDNQAAQCLTRLDASNLRQNKEALSILRERMFTLWGNLEEKKMDAQEAARKGEPPADSDDENGQVGGNSESGKMQLTNRPFPCCIQQYGVKVSESDPARASAGNGKRWQRMFRLFGTMIAGG